MSKLIPKISLPFILIVILFLQSSKSLEPGGQTQTLLKSQESLKGYHLNFDFGKIPLYFIPNEDQVNENALYYAHTSRYTLWVTKEGLVFDSLMLKDKQDRKKGSKLKAQT